MRNNISKKLKRAIQLEIKHCIALENYERWLDSAENEAFPFECILDNINSKVKSLMSKADERSYEAYLDLNQSEKEYMDSRNWYPKECETYEEALEYYK